jgi:DNA-binding winged helix-turn-helix (wHTH) protein
MVLDLPRDGLVGWITALVGVSPDGAIAAANNARLIFVRDRREVSVGGRMVRLTRLEAEVLAALVDAAPNVLSRETLIESVWRRAFVGSNVVDAVVRTLRRKIGPEARRIATVPKAGYRYVE